jgi:peptide/nickel transport system substrate-binding protein
MKKKTLFLALLMVASIVFCMPIFAAGEDEGEMTGAATTGPQYGGTYTPFLFVQASNPSSPAVMDGVYNSLHWSEYSTERPVGGDIETYGARGTGEHEFKIHSFQVPDFLTGKLIESWENTVEKLVWHVRPGIHWQADHVDFMESRELTADDMVADIHLFLASPWGGRFDGLITKEGVYATDKYTVVIEYEQFSFLIPYYLGYEDRSLQSPPEVEAAGADKWENLIGTGAFRFEELIPGSYMSYVKVDDYWDTTTIDGVEYKMPFMDRIVLPIIPDQATQFAALRSGKLDYYSGVPITGWTTLDKTPGIKYSAYPSLGEMLYLRSDSEPFDDVKVRQAMMIGTDLKAFAKLFKAEDMSPYWMPISSANPKAHIPWDELPADIQLLYDYNPDLAKKMLAEAGYPNGFKTRYLSMSTPDELDEANLLVDMWAKIGVDVEVDSFETTVYRSKIYSNPPDFEGSMTFGIPTVDPTLVYGMYYRTDGYCNFGEYSASGFDVLSDKLSMELDDEKRNAMAKEASLIVMRDVIGIPLYLGSSRLYYWPWVKGYYGELSIHDWSLSGLTPYMWIDQNMKKEMGFK